MKELNDFLQNLEKGESLTDLGKKIMKVIVVVLVAFVLLIFAQIGIFLGMFNWFESVVRATTGLDAMLAKAIAFLLLALLFGTPLDGFIWSFLPVPQKNKKRKRFILLAVLGVMFFGAYFASKNVYFDPKTGEPVKYYSVGPDGEYKFSSSDGYDPVTGEELKPVTSEMFKKIREAEKAASEQKLIEAAKLEEAERIIKNSRRQDSIRNEYLLRKEREAAAAKAIQEQMAEDNKQAELIRLKKELTEVRAEIERRAQTEKQAAKIAQGKKITNKTAEESKPKEFPTGYRIALNGNSGSSLEDIFVPFVIRAGSGWQGFTCQVSFENNSSFTFDLYNYDRVRLFEIPPGEKTTLPMESGPYRLKARELKEMIPFNIFRKRDYLNVQIYDRPQNQSGVIGM